MKSKHKTKRYVLQKFYSSKSYLLYMYICICGCFYYHYNSVTGTVDCCIAGVDVDKGNFRVGSVL